MANTIKNSADGLALQITKPARTADLVTEDAEGATSRRAPVRVYSFDGYLLVVDRERVSDEDTAELVRALSEYTDSIYRVMDSVVQIAGHGYQVQLPPARDAGFEQDDEAPVEPAPGVLVIHSFVSVEGESVDEIVVSIVDLRRDQVA
ncbi:hypothetical protein ACFQE1_00325 [Halobium palmae]|uniref:Chemotaxis protein CheW n=1 Tax=Halobium palmae TaxID=1776492 RepID=A0ABD5RU20_9EURY